MANERYCREQQHSLREWGSATRSEFARQLKEESRDSI
jgi:hypothetical protein